MKIYELIAPCHFGLESVLKREIQDLGYDVTLVEDGKVTFAADADGIARANMFLRTAERVLIKVGKFKAETFDELFENTKALPWEEFLPKDGKFWVAKAASIKSKLFSPSDIQSIMKKAIVERMKSVYNMSWCPETGAEYPLRVTFTKEDIVRRLSRHRLQKHWRQRSLCFLHGKRIEFYWTHSVAAVLFQLKQQCWRPILHQG